ncbi:MAG: polymer-forming cytoskeletal protein [Pseudomonadota bacterium]
MSVQASAGAAVPPPSPGQPPHPGSRTAGRPGDRTAPSLIGQDLTIIGNLVSKGEVHVEGEVQGDIHGTHILIGEKARITGGIIAQDVVVRGHVMGSVRGVKVALQASSHVEGDIYHKSLAIEQGAFFEGRSRRAEDPTAGVQTPEMPPAPPSSNGSA